MNEWDADRCHAVFSGSVSGARGVRFSEVTGHKQLVVITQGICRVVQRNFSVGENISGICSSQSQMHVLLYEQDAAATLVCVLPNDREQALDYQGCQAEAQFVNEQKLGPPRKGSGDREHLLFSAGE
jgi:hypothetical protein